MRLNLRGSRSRTKVTGPLQKNETLRSFLTKSQVPKDVLDIRLFRLLNAILPDRWPVKQNEEELMERSRIGAHKLWEGIDEQFEKQTGKMLFSAKQNFSRQLQKPQTPLSSSAEATKLLTQPQASIPAKTAPYVPIIEPARQEPTATTSVTEPIKSDVKTKKTRRKAQSSTNQPASESSPQQHLEAPHPARSTFTLNARDYTVFRSLFHMASPKYSGPAKAIKWKDFKRAMGNVGFGSEKLMGSAWQFWPGDALKALGVTGKVQIHEPHPEHELRATEARKFGKRLSSQYGWDGDMFELP